jgi:hypothetical protein
MIALAIAHWHPHVSLAAKPDEALGEAGSATAQAIPGGLDPWWVKPG